MFGPVRGQAPRPARVPTRPGSSVSSHQPWGAETRPAGRTALARRMCPSRAHHHQRGFFPTAPFPDRDSLSDVSPSGARVATTCPISPHETWQPGILMWLLFRRKQVVSWHAGTVLRPPALFCFGRGHVQRPRSIAASKPFGRENKAGDAENPNGQPAGWQQAARHNRSRFSGVALGEVAD